MKKNIVVITGSPRKGGNSDQMANAFIKGAGSAGHQITKIVSADLNIQGCRACDACYSTGKPCIFADDFNKIAPSIEGADVIVFATPLYWFSFSQQIKAVIDRCYSLNRGEKGIQGKECVLLTCGADVEKAFAGLVKSYELIADYLKWKDAGQLIAPEVEEKDDVKKGDILKKAEEMGRSI